MKAKEYRAALAALRLSQGAAAKFLGVDPRTSRRWALGEVPVPRPVALLLRVMVRHKLSPNDVLGA
jgi:hypothetical protein